MTDQSAEVEESVEQLRPRVLEARLDGELTDDERATAAARIIVEAVVGGVPLHEADFYDRLKAHYEHRPEALAVLRGLSGRGWLWAEQAARRLLGAKPTGPLFNASEGEE